MTEEDEFKHSGRYLPEGQYVELPTEITEPNWTVTAWFIWMGGNGPLIEAEDGSWEIGREVGGQISYRIGGSDRCTSLPVDAMRRNKWIQVALTKEGHTATLYLNETAVDVWQAAPAEAGLGAPFSAMKGAVGFAADLSIFDKCLSEEKILGLWSVGNERV